MSVRCPFWTGQNGVRYANVTDIPWAEARSYTELLSGRRREQSVLQALSQPQCVLRAVPDRPDP
ncbi:hypothetical protein PSAC2689_110155 [Paraburkholderia sacchari]